MQTKVGALIRALRIDKEMTQKQLADRMNISDKTVSKWERGLGMPEISLISELSGILGVELQNLLSGELKTNDFVNGNLKKMTFFVCPNCHNITICTGTSEVACCGKRLTALTPQKALDHEKLMIEKDENEWLITSDHPMTKANYISFIALITGDRLQLIKLYPEWALSVRIPRRGHEMLMWFSAEQGLLYVNLI